MASRLPVVVLSISSSCSLISVTCSEVSKLSTLEECLVFQLQPGDSVRKLTHPRLHLLVHAQVLLAPVLDVDWVAKPSFADRTDIILDGTVHLKPDSSLLVGEEGLVERLLHPLESAEKFVVAVAQLLHAVAESLVGLTG